jgi:hypothetical protein
MDELYNNKLLNELSLMLGDSQKSQSPSMAQPTNNLSIAPTLDLISSLNENNSTPTSSGLASMEQPVEEEQISESIVETPNETPVSEGGLSQMVQQPKRSEFEITPEMRQISMAIDFLTGSPYGTTMKQISDDYRNITMAQEDKAIGDFERERAYQDTRADKERAYATQERKEQREIEKERRDIEKEKRTEVMDSLSKLSNTVNRKEELSDAAKKRIVERAKTLDPETFSELDDDTTIELLKGYTKPTTGLSIGDRLLLEETKQKGKETLEGLKSANRMKELQLKLANSKQNLEKIESDAKANEDADIISSLNTEIETWYPEDLASRSVQYVANKFGMSTEYTRNVNQVNSIIQTKIAKINGDSRFNENEAKNIINKFGLKTTDDLNMAKSKLANLARYLRPGITKEQTRQMLIQDGLADSKSTSSKSASVKKTEPKKEQSSQTYTKTNKGMAF